jgi:hemerythrin superfamily protein
MAWQLTRRQKLLFRSIAAGSAAVPIRRNRVSALVPGLSLIARTGFAGHSSARRNFRDARRCISTVTSSGAPGPRIRRRSLLTVHQENFMSHAKSKSTDAIALLTADHDKVRKLFKAFGKLKNAGSADDKHELVSQICNELIVHAEIEEEVFYPAVRDAIDDKGLIDEANVEHASARTMIGELQEMEPDDELYDAKVTVLGEYVNHHIREEEDELFPQAKKAKMDTAALGNQLLELKKELLEDIGETSEE